MGLGDGIELGNVRCVHTAPSVSCQKGGQARRAVTQSKGWISQLVADNKAV